MITLRILKNSDWADVWAIIGPVFRAGETYAFSPEITEEEAFRNWVTLPTATYVATDEGGAIIGTYYIKPNQQGPGAHVCNCGYIVSEAARGRGIAAEMCDHSQQQARALGFRAMQYNLVVSANVGAVRLWEKLGFEIVGTLPDAFNHPHLGYVDAHVMYKILDA